MSPSNSVDDCLVPWKRLWLPLDREAKWYAAGEGFLEDWDDIFGFRPADGPKHLDELLGLRCLILCGEPGMGKSKALELHRPQIEENARRSGELYWRAVREALSPEHLLLDLKGSSQWQKWIAGGELTVVIDGVDEGLALAAGLVAVLAADLRDQPVARLRLILVSRDAEWPVDEGRVLMRLWPSEQAGRFQLQRLRFTDADQAARHWGLSEPEAEAFLSAVLEKSIESFAARPMTLRMLVDEFKADRQLSGTRAEIFRRACLRLCKEDPARVKFLKKSPHYYEFTAEQILPTVKKAASWMLLRRLSAVSRSPSYPQHLDFERLVPVDADDRQRANVEAALGCALFCDAGSQSRTFAHQSYAEYLAAEYLSEFPLAQVLNLVCIHDGPERFIVPQLAELAAWLALRHEDFADWVIEHEPEVLLRNDASSLSESRRGRFVSRFLERMAREEAFDNWDLNRFYAGCRHAGLAGQLRPYLVDRQASPPARQAAVRLAGVCKLGDLFEELLAIAKDATAQSDLREQAMDAVCGLIPSDRLSELEPFALCEAGPDPPDRLRGAAIKALVPRRWKVSRALPALAKPSNQDAFGEFDMVCGTYLPKQVDVTDLPAILQQLTRIDYPFHGPYNRIHSVACRAFVLAACNLDKAEIAAAFLDLVKTKLRQEQFVGRVDDPGWTEAVAQSELVRRRVAELFVSDDGLTSEELSELLCFGFFPLQTGDCPWVLRQLEAANQTLRPRWAMLACPFWHSIMEIPWRDDFLDACQRIPELAVRVGWPCAILLGSAEEKHCRESWSWQKRRQQEAANRPRKATPQELFDAAMTAALADWRQWPRLSRELQRGQDGSDAGISPDPMNDYRWGICNEKQRAQVIRCARDFLMNETPSGSPRGTEGEVAFEAFWALWLTGGIIRVDSELQAAVMSKWFESLFAQPFGGAKEEQEQTRLGVVLDPSRAGGCLRHRLERALQGKSSMAVVLSGFELAWAAPFTATLLVLLDEHDVSGMPLWDVIRFLARRDSPAAQSWLDKSLNPTSPANAAMILAMALLSLDTETEVRTAISLHAQRGTGISLPHLSWNRFLAPWLLQRSDFQGFARWPVRSHLHGQGCDLVRPFPVSRPIGPQDNGNGKHCSSGG